MMKFVMISKDDCSWCEKARKLMFQKGIDVDIIKVEPNSSLREFMLLMNWNTVPMIWEVYDNHTRFFLGGYEDLIRVWGEDAA